jgi:hypothetical protein
MIVSAGIHYFKYTLIEFEDMLFSSNFTLIPKMAALFSSALIYAVDSDQSDKSYLWFY